MYSPPLVRWRSQQDVVLSRLAGDSFPYFFGLFAASVIARLTAATARSTYVRREPGNVDTIWTGMVVPEIVRITRVRVEPVNVRPVPTMAQSNVAGSRPVRVNRRRMTI